PPVQVLAPVRASVPVPSLFRPTVPVMGALMVTMLVPPRPLTVIVGVPALVARVSAFVPATVQLAAVVVSVSPKIIWPTLTGMSSVTVELSVMLRELKSATSSVALGTMPPFQLAVALQFPPPSVSHCPVAAWLVLPRPSVAATASARVARFFPRRRMERAIGDASLDKLFEREIRVEPLIKQKRVTCVGDVRITCRLRRM